MGMLDTVKSWLKQIAEVGLLLIAAAVVLEIIFGAAVPFLGISILSNITALTRDLGEQGLVGIISIAIINWLNLRRLTLNNKRSLAMMDTVKNFLRGVMDVAMTIIPLSVVLGVIFGPAVPFIGADVIDNISALVSDLGGGGLVGIITLGILYWLARR